MNHDEAMEVVAASLRRVAPEIDLAEVDHDRPMSEEMELDSMDVLSLVTEVHQRSGVQIPESDYPLIDTVTALADYLVRAG